MPIPSEMRKDDAAERATSDETHAQAPDEGRREALKAVGKYGAYTAPALIAMLTAERAVAQTQ